MWLSGCKKQPTKKTKENMLALVQAERIPRGAIWSHMATNTCQCFFFFSSKANSCTDTEHIHRAHPPKGKLQKTNPESG